MSFSKEQQTVSISVFLLRIKMFQRQWQLEETMEEFIVEEHIVKLLTNQNDLKLNDSFKEGIQNLKVIKQAGRLLIDNIIIHKLEWVTYFGTGDASLTGLISGGLWSIKGAADRLIQTLGILTCQPKLKVVPHFQQKLFKSDFLCIFSIQLVKAIFISIKMIGNHQIKQSPIK